MTKKKRVVIDNATLRSLYSELVAGDLVVGRLRLLPSEEHLLLDLRERGVELFPPALSQLASRSKTLQVSLYARQMLPLTWAVHDIHGLQQAMAEYHQHKIGRVVTKLDRKNGGLGIHLWSSVEEVFNQASLGVLPYPFVLQPFCPESRDIRVVVLGDYVEAYFRENATGFRNNLHFGGQSKACDLTAQQWSLCQEVMARGRFPYAHIDLLVLPDKRCYLGEINLRGGIRGANITPADYRARQQAIHAEVIGNG
ncbi:MAG: hypothetical protein OEY01_08355 [Desulfobulbaceae bacterium]|nr:hypothetical protein [Desulfobulbaceae bacterium]HIJ79015.1 hypothetical protein [Deltaproteobacteria bacterium]